MTVDDNFCSMKFLEKGDETSPWQHLGHISGSTETSSDNSFSTILSLQDVSYAPFRRLFSETFWRKATGASVKCRVGVKIYVYGLIPVHLYTDVGASMVASDSDLTLHYSSSGISGTSAMKFSRTTIFDYGGDDDSSFNVAPFLHFVKKAVKKMKVLTETVANKRLIGLHTNILNPFLESFQSFDSFIVSVPELSAAITLLGDAEGGGRYHFSSSSFMLQLSKPVLHLNVDLSVQCSDSFNPSIPETDLHSCSWIYGDGAMAVWDSLSAGKLNIAIDSASPRNFLAELAGTKHNLIAEIADYDDIEDAINSRLRGSIENDRALSVSSQDPRISNGGHCVSGTADNVYDSFTCAVVEKGFFKVFLYVFDEDGLLTKFQLLTSWAPKAPFAAATEAVVLARGGYFGEWNSTISEFFQNATTSLRYEDNGLTKLRAGAVAQWDFVDPVERGSVDFLSFAEGISEKVDASMSFRYGDNMYTASGAAAYNDSESLNTVHAFADGGYGGDLFNWWLRLNDSAAFFNRDKQGDARGYISSAVSSSGDDATFVFNLLVNDGNEIEQLATRNNVSWISSSSWTEAGNIALNSLFYLVNVVDWDAHGHLHYDDNLYSGVVSEYGNNGEEQLLAFAKGAYAGGWTDWFASIAESGLWWSDDKVGSVLGSLTSKVNTDGNTADITLKGSVLDANNTEFIFTSDEVSWMSIDGNWLKDGTIDAHSIFTYPALVQWNTSGLLTYGNHSYYVHADDVSTGGDNLFELFGTGGYGGSSFLNWWASLVESAVYSGGSKVGDAVGYISAMISSTGVDGKVSFYTAVNGGNETLQVLTNNTAVWYSPTKQWLNAGSISVSSMFELVNIVNWDAWGLGEYRSNHYVIKAANMDLSGNPNFSLFGAGGYGGSDFLSWWASLVESAVYSGGSKIGDAVGYISTMISSTGVDGKVSFYTAVNGGNETLQVLTNNTAVWYSPTKQWLNAGSISVSSMFELVNIVNWDAWGLGVYEDNTYRLRLLDSTVNGDSQLDMFAAGRYGGSWYSWSANLDESFLFVSGSKVGSAMGNISCSVTPSGDDISLAFYAVAYDGDNVEQVRTGEVCKWDVDASTGIVSIGSYFYYTGDLLWSANGFLNYADNAYTFSVSDYVDLPDYIFFLNGEGGYGGSFSDWWASLTKSSLTVDSSLVGTATGYVSSVIAGNGDSGHLTFSVLAFDGSEVPVLQLSTNNTADWLSPSGDWLSDGNITVASTTQVEQILDWDAFGSFDFSGGNYSVYVSDDDLDGDSVFFTYGSGEYRGTWGNWALTVTESQCYINNAKQGSMTAALEWFNYNSFQTVNGLFTTTVLGGNDESLFYTLDQINWFDLGRYGAYDYAQGIILSNTEVNGSPAFLLFSEFKLDQSNQTAAWNLVESLQGEIGLNATARAFYDVNYGLLTGIDATVSYQSDMIFQAHTSWDAQVQTLNSPVPTTAPTIGITASPSQLPSFSPTVTATISPSVAPGQPTMSPTGKPSVGPTYIITALPTMRPSVRPTFTPTFSPSNQNAPLLSFTSDISMSGVSSTTLDSSSQQAVISATATSMGISTNSVVYLSSSVATTTGLRYNPNKMHLFATSYSIVAKVKTSVPVSSSTTSSDLYKSLTAQLTQAVTSGEFTTTLQDVSVNLGASETATAAATQVTDGPAEVTDLNSDDDNEGLSTGAIAGIVIGTVAVLIIFVIGLLYYRGKYVDTSTTATAAPRTASGAHTSSSDMFAEQSKAPTFSTDSTVSKLHSTPVAEDNL